MNYQIACNILNIKLPISKGSLKKAYLMAALENHPDKNNSPDSTSKFQNIIEAYNFLNNIIEDEYNFKEEEENNSEYNHSQNNYNELITQFLSIGFDKIKNIDPEQLQQLIKCFKNNCKNFSVNIIKDFKPETILKIWEYINYFKHILNFSEETLLTIENVIKKRLENNSIIILNPTLNNILQNDTFKLQFEDEIFYVPLWRDLSIFYLKNKEILYVKCIPDLPDNISINKEGNNYNINININTSIKSILNSPINFYILNKNFIIPTDELKIKNYQKFIFKKKGINNLNDQLETISIGSIIVHIYINFKDFSS